MHIKIFLSATIDSTMRFIYSPVIKEPMIFVKFAALCNSYKPYHIETCRFCNANAAVGLADFRYPFNYENIIRCYSIWICRSCESHYRCYRPDIEEIESAAMAFEKKRQTHVKTYIKTLIIPNICNIINAYLEDTEPL